MKKLLLFFLVLLALTGFGAAQDISLTDLPKGEKFTSTEDGFSISLPKAPGKSERTVPAKAGDEKGAVYTWVFKEGIINIKYAEYSDGTVFRTESDYKMFFDGVKVGLTEEGLKVLSSEPFMLGTNRGMKYKAELEGITGQIRAIVFDNKSDSLTGAAFSRVPGSEALIVKALDTFSVDSPQVKPSKPLINHPLARPLHPLRMGTKGVSL